MEEKNRIIINFIDEPVRVAWEMETSWQEGLSFFHTSKFSTYEYEKILIAQIKQCIEKECEFDEVFEDSDFKHYDRPTVVAGLFAKLIKKIFENTSTKEKADEARNNYIDCMEGLILPWVAAWMDALRYKEDDRSLYLSIKDDSWCLYPLYRAFSRISDTIFTQRNSIVAHRPDLISKLDSDNEEVGRFFSEFPNFVEKGTIVKINFLQKMEGILHQKADLFNVSKGGDENFNKKQKTVTCMRCGVFV